MAFRTNKTPTLQKKMASGNPVTFDCALNKPLLECVVSFFATQSGSGTPSPDNVRTINGWSTIGISATGKNIGNKDLFVRGTIGAGGADGASSWRLRSPFIPVKPDTSYSFMCNSEVNIYEIHKYGANGEYCGYNVINATSTIYTFPSNVYYTKVLIRYSNNDKIHVTDLTQFQIVESETVLPYEPFGTYTTIQIGSTVYGGEYDARTGLFKVTHGFETYDGSADETWDAFNIDLRMGVRGRTTANKSYVDSNISNIFVNNLSNETYADEANSYTWRSSPYVSNLVFFYVPLSENITTVEQWRAWLSNHPTTICYELATPQTIQLPPCPIDTLEGVNTIFADSGDVSVVFNDLDLAKRGSFREVFKLPS